MSRHKREKRTGLRWVVEEISFESRLKLAKLFACLTFIRRKFILQSWGGNRKRPITVVRCRIDIVDTSWQNGRRRSSCELLRRVRLGTWRVWRSVRYERAMPWRALNVRRSSWQKTNVVPDEEHYCRSLLGTTLFWTGWSLERVEHGGPYYCLHSTAR